MGRPAELTKQWLLNHGVTNVTEDGHIFKGEDEVTQFIIAKSSRFKTMQYKAVLIYDRALYECQKRAGQLAIGNRTIMVHRAVWAWFNGLCPANMDVDHINDDPLDNRLENLQLLTRKENLAKRKYLANQ